MIYWYIGETQSGKTTLALRLAREQAARTRRPLVVLDLMPALTFANCEHARDVADLARRAYERGAPETIYTPGDRAETDAALRVISAAGSTVVIIDEARWILSWRSISETATRFLRSWAHRGLSVHLTTQRLGDIHQDCWACSPRVYLFRIRGRRDLMTAANEWNVDPARLRSLKVGEYVMCGG